MKTVLVNFVVLIVILLQSNSYGKELQPLDFSIHLPEQVMAAEDISAITKMGSFVVIGSDEAVGKDKNENYIQFLKKDTDGNYQVYSNNLLLEGNKTEGKEMDIEGLTVEGAFLYIIGSHASKRKNIKEIDTYKNNRKKFKHSKIKDEQNRDWLFRLKIDADGQEISKKKITLRKIIKNDDVLKTFTNIPGKENGIDIEGIAAKDGWLYAGFRGPVFRNGYVPLLKLKFNDPENTYDLLYIQLGGRGIRDITSVSDGFLIVAGPVGDSQESYQLYHWDGKDTIPGTHRKHGGMGEVSLLGEIRPPEHGKAEGVVVLEEDDSLYHLIIAYDGVKNKNEVIQHFRIAKP